MDRLTGIPKEEKIQASQMFQLQSHYPMNLIAMNKNGNISTCKVLTNVNTHVLSPETFAASHKSS